MRTLLEICKQYEMCEDCIRGTDKESGHGYIQIYEELFAPYRETASVIVELGVSAGFSLLMLDILPSLELF